MSSVAESIIKRVLEKSEVVNNLTSTLTDKPLSANQGKLLDDKIYNNGTHQVVTGTWTTGATGNIAIGLVADGKTIVAGAHAVGNDAFIRAWRATSNGGWYFTAVNPNTGATMNNTEMTIKYLKITFP